MRHPWQQVTAPLCAVAPRLGTTLIECLYLVIAEVLNECERRLCKNVEENVLLSITIFVDKAFDVVDDGSGVMSNAELRVPLSPILALDVVGVRVELGVDVGQVGRVAALRKIHF